jgi:hypothetical protein
VCGLGQRSAHYMCLWIHKISWKFHLPSFVDTQKAFPQYHIHGINTWAHEQHVSGKQNKVGDPKARKMRNRIEDIIGN